MSLMTTRSTLMHAALARVSPELREFDVLAFGALRLRTRSRPRLLSSMPTEILLLIRSQLLPILITHFIATSAAVLQTYEASLRHLICPQCTFYNEYVYGPDVWTWHLSGPCSCAPHPAHTHRPGLNPTQFRDRHHWLEAYLSRQSLHFRGLSPQSSSPAAIWDVVTDVLRSEFGCEAVRKNPSRRGGGMALLSRWDRQSILVVPLHSTHAPYQKSATGEYCNWTTRALFRRLERDLGLSWDYTEPRHTFHGLTPPQSFCPTFEIPASTQTPCGDVPIIAAVLLQFLEAITTPFSAIFSVLLSFVALFFTVLCYYSRPGALRLF
ncbi:hypothetical protein DFH09DRAFT_560867 [Mycena vulgaris]|nr:hypothetical protein DFH09DRAFT_560867 [Mycena vulgaris]